LWIHAVRRAAGASHLSRPLSHNELVQLQRIAAQARFFADLGRDKDVIRRAPRDGRPGRPAVFCDAAIQFCLSIKILFKLPLRQTSGMVANRLKLAGLHWPVPDFSTLCRRQKTLTVQIPFRRADGPLNLLVPLGTLLRNALPGSGRRLRYTSLPHRHPRARPHSDHPDPKERAGVQRRLPARTRPQRHPARRGATEGHSGRAGRGTAPAAASRRNLSSFARKRLPVSGCAA
jgi:hypothetical protein